MSQKYEQLIKNVGILTISNFASKILVFLLVPLYTSVLSTEEYGIYDIIVTTVQLLFPIITANIVDAVMRFSMEKGRSREMIATIGLRYILQSIIIVFFFLIIIDRAGIFSKISGYGGYFAFYYVFYTLNQYFIQFAKGLERVTDMGIAGISGTVVMIIGNLLFLLVFKSGLSGFFWANILAQAVPCIYYFIRLKFWNYIKPVKIGCGLEQEMLCYCTPLVFTAIGWWINGAADRYVVSFMIGVSANGILSVAYKIPSIINTLQSIFVQAWQISAIKEYGLKGTKRFYGDIFTSLNFVMCIACSVFIALSRPLASILYAKEFYIAWMYVPFLLVSSVLNSASGLLGPILAAKKDSKNMALSSVYGSICNIIFNIIFVYFIGIQGAAIATVLSSFAIFALRKKAVNSIADIPRSWKIYISWTLLAIQSIFESYLKCYLLEMLIFLTLICVNHDLIKTVYVKVRSHLRGK